MEQHRENKFIPADKDIDIGVFKMNYHPDIVKEIEKSSKFCRKASRG